MPYGAQRSLDTSHRVAGVGAGTFHDFGRYWMTDLRYPEGDSSTSPRLSSTNERSINLAREGSAS